jgi:NADH-quinone oxidoreductase subunit L
MYIAWIPLLPLAAFVLLGCWGKRLRPVTAGWIGILTALGSLLLAILATYHYGVIVGPQAGRFPELLLMKFAWLPFNSQLSIDMSILLDPASLMMILVVCFVSLMVQLFSLGYMRGEQRFSTYYAFLSLFTFSMLGLVLAGNLFQIYIFWELVGLSSYLLIGFYFTRPTAVAAAKKAFIVTRFADLGFLIGILILGLGAQTLDLHTLLERLSTPSVQAQHMNSTIFLGMSSLSWGLILVFVGGAGKSAMFPLHVWLPDAMEGPTPVSALIHAATMVVAGVYLVARLFPAFSYSGPTPLGLVRYVGAGSALLAAAIACTQTDIKRVLAYSTMSQIGFMMLALGSSGLGGAKELGYSASLFHLFTHAFFKSLLFLAAGIIIHQVHSNEMEAMGGLRKALPLTHICFLIGCLAIAGIPPFAGFFSKENILLAAFQADRGIYLAALFSSGLTSFYMFRLYFHIFWWKSQPAGLTSRPKAEWTMGLPLLVLASCSSIAGLVPFPRLVSADGYPVAEQPLGSFSVLPVLVSFVGLGIASFLYARETERPRKLGQQLGRFYRIINHKFYIDEIYLFVTRDVIVKGLAAPAAWVDRRIVDGFINGLARSTAWVSQQIRGLQSGRLQQYMMYFFAGLAVLAIVILYLWKP